MSVQELAAQAMAAIQRGDAQAAVGFLQEAEALAPLDAELKMQRALAHRMGGALPAAIAALDEALAIQPYNFLAMLSKGAILERLAGERAASRIYRNALEVAPADDRAPPHLKAPLARAREVVTRVDEELDAFLRSKLGPLDVAGGEQAVARIDEAIGVYSGRRKIYNQQPLLLHYPRLPAIPFYPRELFPWLPDLEAATDVIRQELMGLLEGQMDAFAPYIAFPPGAPVNQWEELNHSRRWSSMFLWRDGERQDAVCARCPRTAALLENLPMARQEGFAPVAMFSALEPHTHIPAHTGSTNVRLLTHLPLILPGEARFRVGNDMRRWRMGEAWVFDDTIEHEAWNDADEMRVILIFDVWNPYLEAGERDLVSALMTARNDFYS
jgi:aspartate beta-hydroxylase